MLGRRLFPEGGLEEGLGAEDGLVDGVKTGSASAAVGECLDDEEGCSAKTSEGSNASSAAVMGDGLEAGLMERDEELDDLAGVGVSSGWCFTRTPSMFL